MWIEKVYGFEKREADISIRFVEEKVEFWVDQELVIALDGNDELRRKIQKAIRESVDWL